MDAAPTASTIDVEAIADAARAERAVDARRRARGATAISVAITVTWFVTVTAFGWWGRVVDNWVASLTMVFGSFVAGSTPQGGGAVAFPVFTKALEIPSEVARTFALCIQTVGMGCASFAILLRRRTIDVRALAISLPAALVGFLVGVFVLTDRNEPFAPSLLPEAYVKMGFTLLVAAMAYVAFLGFRVQALQVQPRVVTISRRYVGVLIACGLVGGLVSAQVGSGADVLMYLALVVLAGVRPGVGVQTGVLVMSTVSLVGLVILGLVDGQLLVGLDAVGDVARVGGEAVTAIDARAVFGAGPGLDRGRYDLFGLWLAAVPIVAWGAPLGSLVSSKVADRKLVLFVVALAAIEIATTIIFLDELRTDRWLLAFSVGALAVLLTGLGSLQRHRVRVLGLDAVDGNTTLTRTGLDIGPRYVEQLRADRPEIDPS